MSDEHDEYDYLEPTPLAVAVVKLNGDVETACLIIDALAEYAASLMDSLGDTPGIAFTDDEPRGVFIRLTEGDPWDEEVVQ